MAAGLLDELSPNEETTLFRIANRGDCVHDLRGTSVARLIALAFVEKHGTCLALTDLGRERARPTRPPVANKVIFGSCVTALISVALAVWFLFRPPA